MSNILAYTTVSLICYLLGCLNGAYLISKLMTHKDIRDYGSGNAGATNVGRVFGWKVAAPSFIFDFMKGFLAFYVPSLLGFSQPATTVLAGFFVAAGHNWPFYLNFKGGKGVAASFGVVTAASPITGLVISVTFLSMVFLTKYVSIGSLSCAVTASISAALDTIPIQNRIVVFVLASMLVLKHQNNIKRLLNGTETKIGKKTG